MNTLQKIGKVTKNMRVARGLSQEQFCSQCGIDQHYISNIENGQRNISIDVVERISSFFGLSLTQFFAAVETMQSYTAEEPHNGPVVVSESTPRTHRSNPIPYDATEQSYVRWMKNQGLSKRTMNSYSTNTVNCIDVQNIIKNIAGTQNLYNITDRNKLKRIIQKIKESEFDKIGHSMYSSGVKKWMAYLDATNQ